MGELLVAIGIMCQVNWGNAGYMTTRQEFQQACQRRWADCVLRNKGLLKDSWDETLLKCVAGKYQ